ncbi:hypothetical protein HFO63_34095 [Rhizobium laguerreae]|uniref:hypothetical protein n=1 Tax=Rhizobium laguerreae TaxID=1076926 RepID=UPI001C90E15B|nr:hypothetical protein [Rhizobium laguerreae]MBY3150524.1 hypothetical protein [Rhizobium laguerreae]MBY3169806.1 hypothetical protein [Rhizobium laguerreae]MBY3193039.1 hypothetical protein [Rhizobium laguerreae]
MGHYVSYSSADDTNAAYDAERIRQQAVALHQEYRPIHKPSYVSSDMVNEMLAAHDPNTVDVIVDGIAMTAEQARAMYESCTISRDQYARGMEAGMHRVGDKGWKVREDRTRKL